MSEFCKWCLVSWHDHCTGCACGCSEHPAIRHRQDVNAMRRTCDPIGEAEQILKAAAQ